MTRKANFCASAALAALSVSFVGASPARAQNAPVGEKADAPLPAIIVTAQRRAQDIRDVPISVTAINDEAL